MSDSPIVGRIFHTHALLDVTGATPVKLFLHEDGTVTWTPIYMAFAEKETE